MLGHAHGFRLDRRAAIALSPEALSQLRVNKGTLWLTRSGDEKDYFLAADTPALRLRAGEVWVAESMGGEARFDLDAVPVAATIKAPRLAFAATPTPVLRAAAAGFAFAAGFFAFAERKAASMASRAQGAMKCRASIACSGAVT